MSVLTCIKETTTKLFNSSQLCKVWRIKKEVESLQVGNLLMGCHEANLSSFWFLLSHLKHARRDDLKDSLSKTVFCLNTMLAVKLFVHDNEYSNSSDSGDEKKCELRLHVNCSDSRGDFLLTQREHKENTKRATFC